MSDVYKKGYSPQTRAIHSSRNRLYAIPSDANTAQVLGVVSNFAPTDARDVETVRGIGFGDQIAELVPQMSQAITITLTRTALYEMNIFQALGYKGGIDGLVRALKHHRWPFDLRQEIVVSDLPTLAVAKLQTNTPSPENNPEHALQTNTPSPENNPEHANRSAIATLYAGCWITNYSTSYTADTAIIAEEVSLSVTDIFAYSGNAKAALEAGQAGSKSNSIISSPSSQR